ncbi:LysR family transcriptional regulator [Cereibacter johrii]|uniref:LysR family transcriptional regulator n=1 Tax=Cereibacter johrii TaxID=445629 RepID=UPI000847C6F7|nr:LysR family transcriptional regulator [Cereibacter johrii]ODM44012.1 LysR family transcriptional regulator [Cereibacter johrii]
MPRNLDLTALRSFVAVADAGGVTRAAGFLNLTQSAVSMQIKRLEETLDLALLDRSARRVALTAAGEQLLGYARRMLALNDEVFGRLTHDDFEGEVVLGVPHDIVYPAIPQVLQRFSAEFPRMRVTLLSSYTRKLKSQFARGECDVIMTTEDTVEPGGETLVELPLVWVGAPGGQAWKQRPLRLAFEPNCIFRMGGQSALDAAGIPWTMAVESDSSRTIEASVSADLAVHVSLAGAEPRYMERIPHGGTLPDLETSKVNLYVADPVHSLAVEGMAELIRRAYAAQAAGASAPRPLAPVEGAAGEGPRFALRA